MQKNGNRPITTCTQNAEIHETTPKRHEKLLGRNSRSSKGRVQILLDTEYDPISELRGEPI